MNEAWELLKKINSDTPTAIPCTITLMLLGLSCHLFPFPFSQEDRYVGFGCSAIAAVAILVFCAKVICLNLTRRKMRSERLEVDIVAEKDDHFFGDVAIMEAKIKEWQRQSGSKRKRSFRGKVFLITDIGGIQTCRFFLYEDSKWGNTLDFYYVVERQDLKMFQDFIIWAGARPAIFSLPLKVSAFNVAPRVEINPGSKTEVRR